MNYTPYEMKLLLDIHSGVAIPPSRQSPLFFEALAKVLADGLVREVRPGYVGTGKLAALMTYVLSAPR